jgi:hypothetical protein
MGNILRFARGLVVLKSMLLAILVIAAAQIAIAADPAAQFVTKLFIEVCVPNLGRPENVRSWAERHGLKQIQDSVALDVFVGKPSEHGAAWAVPANAGQFALSIRGQSHACAVWARAADPTEVSSLFKKLIDGVKRPGIEISLEKDSVVATPVGQARALIYLVKPVNGRLGYSFTLLTAERAGGAFQVSIQATGTILN